MTTATWCFVDLATGEFTGALLRGGLAIGLLERDSLLPVIGDYMPSHYRYDLALQKVIKRDQPLQEPETTGAAAIDAFNALRAADAASIRALRELVLAMAQGLTAPAAALERLLALDQEAPARRAELQPPP
jgi:hypothetical protein